MEENATDILKGFTLALQSLGVNVSEGEDKAK